MCQKYNLQITDSGLLETDQIQCNLSDHYSSMLYTQPQHQLHLVHYLQATDWNVRTALKLQLLILLSKLQRLL